MCILSWPEKKNTKLQNLIPKGENKVKKPSYKLIETTYFNQQFCSALLGYIHKCKKTSGMMKADKKIEDYSII